MRALALIIAVWAVLVPGSARAQYWATKELCTVDKPQVHAQVFAPFSPDDIAARGAEIANGTGRLWRVETANGAVSHLWGTLHLNDRHILAVPDHVTDLVQSARLAAFEFDPIPASRRHLEQARFADGVWPQLRSSRAPDLPQDILGNIRSRLIGLGFSAGALERLTLAGLAELVLTDPCNDFGAGAVPTQDMYLYTRAVIAGVERLGLDRIDHFRQTLNAPENKDLALAILTLYGDALNPDQTREARATSHALYLSGRLGMLLAWNTAYLQNRFGFAAATRLSNQADGYLIQDRNLRFLDTMRHEFEKGDVFMAIGFAHLPGPEGVIALLRKAGFDVARLPLPGEVP